MNTSRVAEIRILWGRTLVTPPRTRAGGQVADPAPAASQPGTSARRQHGIVDLRTGKPEMPWPDDNDLADTALFGLGLTRQRVPAARPPSSDG
jgi:hypothetical protein